MKIKVIESARGFAALYVFFAHIVQKFFASNKILSFIGDYSHQCVVLFFLLSGFSISYAYQDRELNNVKSILKYYFARARRIMPIFYLVMIFAIIELFLLSYFNKGITYQKSDIWGSLLFLSDLRDCVFVSIPTNRPIWSLTYEMFYYLLFPFLLLLQQKIGATKTFILVLFISIISMMFELFGNNFQITNILSLYCIWSAGALIGYFRFHKITFVIQNFVISLGISSALALIVLNDRLLSIEFPSSIVDWLYSVVFVFIMLVYLVKHDFILQRNKIVSLLLSVAVLLFPLIFIKQFEGSFLGTLLKMILYLAFIFAICWGKLRSMVDIFLKPFFKIGAFSYGLYIFHWPIIYIAIVLSPFVETMLLIPVTIFIVFVISYWLELKYHPYVVNIVNPK